MIEFGEDLLDVISENFTTAVAKPLKSLSLSDRYAEATDFAPARALCRRFRDDIDAACLKEFENASTHFSVNGAKHLDRAHKCFLTFTAMRTNTCVLCHKSFSGSVSELGVYAHPDCIKSAKRVTLFYLKPPLTTKAVERLGQTHPLLAPLVKENVESKKVA